MRHRHGRHGPRSRSRHLVGPGGDWRVHARVERFAEPALLLLLGERSAHGYDLLERLPLLLGENARIDMGNLYRVLRGLEEEGFVTSDWDASAPGPAKRRYWLTPDGSNLLRAWISALEETRRQIEMFIARYENVGRG